MTKLTFRYARYALSTLSAVGFSALWGSSS
jgi:hypothetical protein